MLDDIGLGEKLTELMYLSVALVTLLPTLLLFYFRYKYSLVLLASVILNVVSFYFFEVNFFGAVFQNLINLINQIWLLLNPALVLIIFFGGKCNKFSKNPELKRIFKIIVLIILLATFIASIFIAGNLVRILLLLFANL